MTLARSQERRADLRNTSVLEVIIAIILVLLVFIYHKDFTFKDSEAELQSALNEVRELKKSNLDLRKKNKKLLRDLKSLKAENEMLRENVAGDGGAGLIETIRPLEIENQKLKTEMDRLILRIKKLRLVNERLNAENIRLHKEIEKLKSEVEEIEKGEEQDNPPGGKGDGMPNCRSNIGSFNFLLAVKRVEDEYEVEFLPDKRVLDDLRTKVMGLEKLIIAAGKRTLTMSEFKKLSRPIYNWGRIQNPECRFRAKYLHGESINSKYYKEVYRYFYATPILVRRKEEGPWN